jgi:hypothetical protein
MMKGEVTDQERWLVENVPQDQWFDVYDSLNKHRMPEALNPIKPTWWTDDYSELVYEHKKASQELKYEWSIPIIILIKFVLGDQYVFRMHNSHMSDDEFKVWYSKKILTPFLGIRI